MSKTLVLQSHCSPLPYSWLSSCLSSVEKWCEINQYEYQFLGDELFELVVPDIIEKTKNQKVITSDLARLLLMKQSLQKGIERVVWLDADFLIFDPENFILPNERFAVGREIWVQLDKNNSLKVYKKVHNAFLMFHSNNHFLDFYIETAKNLILKNTGTMSPQFIGPKLLTALHNISSMPVMESAAMLSPLVIKDFITHTDRALEVFLSKSVIDPAGANLCCSSIESGELNEREIKTFINKVLQTKNIK